MHFNLAFITAAVLSASSAMAATIIGFAGADCTGTAESPFIVPANFCGTFGGKSFRSIQYSGVPKSIQFYESGGGHDSCTNGSQLTRGGGSGCANAPTG
ncbi:hypothetical protein D9619_004825 [Psilocybe cf. subviscida]|uniref:Uncharacterized protein n=1 Tax=Psilocybe cf. subviscida TaxID=2480587 RepID=A0A8H5BQV6_9AGAR|nr:hypothetical protein D9619_004825 [Psilocybe cf. subviscida]